MLAGYGHLLSAARRLQWDAEAIDLGADREGLDRLSPPSAERIRRLVAGFCVAEAAVAAELSPFVAAAPPGEVRDCFAMQQGDEERHARFFARLATEVVGIDPQDEARALAGRAIVTLFEETLPRRAAALAGGECALSEAVGLYHLVLEGIVFAVGQDALLAACDAAGSLPGMREGVARVQADERWHVGLGVLALAESGRPVDVEGPVALAAGAWGADVAAPERLDAVLAAHRRRLRFLPLADAA